MLDSLKKDDWNPIKGGEILRENDKRQFKTHMTVLDLRFKQ